MRRGVDNRFRLTFASYRSAFAPFNLNIALVIADSRSLPSPPLAAASHPIASYRIALRLNKRAPSPLICTRSYSHSSERCSRAETYELPRRTSPITSTIIFRPPFFPAFFFF